MSEMANETLRQQLGNAGWRLLHTISVKFPVKPTMEDQQDYLDFIRLFAQFYPCGDCARHFQRLLVKLPPRVGSREEVIHWTCEAHNLVNERLGKPIQDCSKVGDMWKCGCAEEELTSTGIE
jgi:FAD-linked sulfhydryl oxidase